MKEILAANAACKMGDCGKVVHAKNLCSTHYQRWRTGKLDIGEKPLSKREQTVQRHKEKIAEDEAVATAEGELLKDEFKELDAALPREQMDRARRMIAKFLYNPKRVAAIMNQYFRRALRSDQVLTHYIKVLVPQQDASPPVQVVINSPLVNQRDEGKVYDITGEVIEDEGKNESKAQ